jgi:class 3 adenylate cyclase
MAIFGVPTSRLCSAAGRGEVIVDDAIAHAVSDEIVVEERERVSLKGFSEPVEVFALSFKGPA